MTIAIRRYKYAPLLAFAAYIKPETAKWGKAVKESGAKVD